MSFIIKQIDKMEYNVEIFGRKKDIDLNQTIYSNKGNFNSLQELLQDYAERYCKHKEIERKQIKQEQSLPTELTAENGAKALLIGEFVEYYEYQDDNECFTLKIPVSWPTIKDIYKKIVDHYKPNQTA